MLDNSTIDTVLEAHEEALGKDFTAYRNHVYRVFLLCQKLGAKEVDLEKYAIAAAFHDLGIWTANTFDYLEPSVELAMDYLNEIGKVEWKIEVAKMIDNHHKMSAYRGEYETSVECFRQADYIDVSLGILKFGEAQKEFRAIKKQFPLKGFHWFLVKQSFKNFLKHPLNPLPMFKS